MGSGLAAVLQAEALPKAGFLRFQNANVRPVIGRPGALLDPSNLVHDLPEAPEGLLDKVDDLERSE